MRNPIPHILRPFMLLLLSLVPVAANAVCPNGTYCHGGLTDELSDSVISLNLVEEVEMARAMITECEFVEGIYEKQIEKEDKEDNPLNEKHHMQVSSEDLHGTYPYESVKEKSAPSVVVANSLNEKFSWKGLILPGGLIAAGVIGMEAGLFKGRGDNDGGVEESDGVNFEDVAQYVPAGAYLTLGLIPGINHKHSFGERTMAAVTAYGMMFLVTRPVKHWIHERRPDLTSNDSFPSGHAATAFTGAELMRLEYGTGIGLGAYALATTVSVLRIHHNRHWFNDVVAGAGVGILGARASYWLLPFERKLFGIKNPKVGVAAFPICNPQSHQFALGCCINF